MLVLETDRTEEENKTGQVCWKYGAKLGKDVVHRILNQLLRAFLQFNPIILKQYSDVMTVSQFYF